MQKTIEVTKKGKSIDMVRLKTGFPYAVLATEVLVFSENVFY